MRTGLSEVWRCTHLANQLHVTILDTVVDHLDVVASTLISDPVAAGLTVTLSSNALEDVLDVGPGLLVTSGHQRGTITSTLFTSRDAAANEADTLLGQRFAATVGIREVGVTTVNNDVTLLKVRQKRLDESVHRLASHDEEDDNTRALELGDEFLDRVGTDNGLAWRRPESVRGKPRAQSTEYWSDFRLTLGLVFQEAIDLGSGTVIGADGEAMIGTIEDQVLTHDGQTDEAKISTRQQRRWGADIDAGQTCALSQPCSLRVNRRVRK